MNKRIEFVVSERFYNDLLALVPEGHDVNDFVMALASAVTNLGEGRGYKGSHFPRYVEHYLEGLREQREESAAATLVHGGVL